MIKIGTQGTQEKTFSAGIRGVTTDVANAVTVMIDSTGQLGTVSSSRRFKEEIRDMREVSRRLLELRPVTFRYKKARSEGEPPLEFGLIAEEVAAVFPELVVYDTEGRPETVKYHLLSTPLLNELQKQQRQLEGFRAQVEELAALPARLAALEARQEVRLATRETLNNQQREVAALADRPAWLEGAEDLRPPPIPPAR